MLRHGLHNKGLVMELTATSTPHNTAKRGRRSYITFLTVLSALAVVLLHADGVFWDFRIEPYWFSANIIDGTFYFAVPIFLMISGATLMDYRERYSTKDFFIKRVKRVLIPFLFWSFTGILWTYLTDPGSLGGLHGIFNTIISGQAYSIFWFFPSLFALYMAIPFISLIPKDKRQQGFGYAIIVGIVTMSAIPFVFSFLRLEWPAALQLPVTGGFVLFALIGYWIDNYELSPQAKKLIYLAGISGLLTHIIGTQILSLREGQISSIFMGYLNLTSVLYSTAIFVAARSCEGKPAFQRVCEALKPLAPLCFGVYLMQQPVLNIIARLGIVDIYSLSYRLLGGVAIFFFCLFVTYVAKKIPYIRHVMG